MSKTKVKLPVTLEEYERLVTRVVRKFKLKDPDHASAVISIAIRHLERDTAFTTLEYLGHSVIKSIANHVADHMGRLVQHDTHIKQLTALLREDPNNNQARDGLEKAASEGSIPAKEALKALETEKVEEPAIAG